MRSTRTGRWVVVAGVGVATGVATLAGQSVLPAEWNRLANSGAIWVTVAFLVGTWLPTDRAAAVGGLVALLLALVGYYVAAMVADASISRASVLLIWAGTAVVGGPVFGLAGRRWRLGAPHERSVAAALLGAVYVAEGVHTLLAIPDLAPTGWFEVGVGIVLTVGLAQGTRSVLLAVAALVPLALLGTFAFEVIDRLLGSG